MTRRCPRTPSNLSCAVTLLHLPLAEPGSGLHRTAGGLSAPIPETPPPPRRLTSPAILPLHTHTYTHTRTPPPVAFVNPRVYGNLCARRWDKRGGGTALGGPGARGTLQGSCPEEMHWMGGWDVPRLVAPPQTVSLPRHEAPFWPSRGEGVGWDQGWGTPRLPTAAPSCVCTGLLWQTLALQGLPARVGTCCGSEPAGSHRCGQGWCQAPGQQGEMGTSMLPAWAARSHGTRHKHLERMCACVSLTDTVWAYMWHT